VFVIAQKANQLGNRLFLFAHLIACAAEHGVRLVNLGFAEYARYFVTTSQDLLCRYPAQASWLPRNARAREVLSAWAARISGSLADGRLRGLKNSALMVLRSGYETTLIDPHGQVRLDSEAFLRALRRWQIIVFLGPLFRDFPSFQKHAASIREYFRPLPIFQANVDTLIQATRESCDVLVGVHIRRGDYRTFVNGRFFYTDDQYLGLVRHARELFPRRKVGFLVCSDEEPPMRVFSRLAAVPGPGRFIEDLHALARCDYLLGPPSTFSLWASFYGQVPLYVVKDPDERPSLDAFRVCRG
jgi:hypothetical protein